MIEFLLCLLFNVDCVDYPILIEETENYKIEQMGENEYKQTIYPNGEPIRNFTMPTWSNDNIHYHFTNDSKCPNGFRIHPIGECF